MKWHKELKKHFEDKDKKAEVTESTATGSSSSQVKTAVTSTTDTSGMTILDDGFPNTWPHFQKFHKGQGYTVGQLGIKWKMVQADRVKIKAEAALAAKMNEIPVNKEQMRKLQARIKDS